MNRNLVLNTLVSSMLLFSVSLQADDSVLPKEPQEKTELTESVQPDVDREFVEKAGEKRKQITNEAVAAVNETRKALKALEEGDTEQALKSLEIATGKLELVLAREPELAFATIDVDVVTYDLIANVDTVKKIAKKVKDYIDDGQIQAARPLMQYLASEMVFSTTSVPLATYPGAIKAITPLIDEGDIDAAKLGLQTALSTLVTVDEIIPLPIVRAERLLANAEELVETENRTEKDNETLSALLEDAHLQLNLAQTLGYGTKKTFKSLHQKIDEVEKKASDGSSGKGWFDKIKDQLKDLV